MNTVTKTVHLNADRDRVFDFLSNIHNLPKWATSFCQGVKQEGDDYKVVRPDGDMFFKINSDPETGVLDMCGGPDKEQMAGWPARVMGLADGTSLFSFTCVQFPGVTDEVFAEDCVSVDEELEVLRDILA